MMMMMMMKVDDGFRLQNVYAPGVSLHPSMSCHVTRSSNHQRGFTHAESDSNPVLGVCCCSSRCQSGDTVSKVWRNEDTPRSGSPPRMNNVVGGWEERVTAGSYTSRCLGGGTWMNGSCHMPRRSPCKTKSKIKSKIINRGFQTHAQTRKIVNVGFETSYASQRFKISKTVMSDPRCLHCNDGVTDDTNVRKEVLASLYNKTQTVCVMHLQGVAFPLALSFSAHKQGVGT